MVRTFDSIDYGAVPDGRTLCTSALQQAIDACHAAGGGRVTCGPGILLTGSLELRSHVELHVARGCRLAGSPRLEDYVPLSAEGFFADRAPEKSALALLRSIGSENVAITGAGTIDGSGLAFYDDPGGEGKLAKPATPRPRIGMFFRCRDLRIEDVTLVDSPCWTLWLMQCDGAGLHRLSIRGNRRMRNVDGIDIDGSRNVTVSDCRIDTEDDSLVVRSIQRPYDTPAACENVVVSNCVLQSRCQGIRIGCPGDGVIRNCVFDNLIITGNNGIVFNNPHRYLAAGHAASADVRNLQFSNVVIDCERAPIKMDVEEGIALAHLGDVSFHQFRIRSGLPILVQGCPETVIENVHFSDVEIETWGEDAILARHCRGIRLTHVGLSNRGTRPEP